jgi:hypothetical protein
MPPELMNSPGPASRGGQRTMLPNRNAVAILPHQPQHPPAGNSANLRPKSASEWSRNTISAIALERGYDWPIISTAKLWRRLVHASFCN